LADEQLGLASMERENLDAYEERILEGKYQQALAKVEDLERRGITGEKVERARKVVEGLESRMARGREEEEEVDVAEVQEDRVEAPVKEEIRRLEGKR
jgi:hypothetical protein